MSKFMTELEVAEMDEFAGLWRLTKPLVFWSDLLEHAIVAPEGFVTDFASVPHILGVYDLEGGKCNKAATIHDLLYTLGSSGQMQITRAQADAVLKEAILASGYSSFTANIFYAAVRLGGGSHWTMPNNPQAVSLSQAAQLAV